MADSSNIMCNFKNCRKVLRKTAWVTSCSHIFCDEDGIKELRSSGECKCPVCGSLLGHTADVVKADLNPPEHFKSMVLAGLSPEVIIDIVNRSFAFWSYQTSLSKKYQDGLIGSYKERLHMLETSYESLITKFRHEAASLKKKIDDLEKELKVLQDRLDESSAKLSEKNRENQKLHTLCNSIRMASLNSCLPTSPVERTKQSFTLGPKTMDELLPPGAQSQPAVRTITHPQSATAIRRKMPANRGFVFNPVTPRGVPEMGASATNNGTPRMMPKMPKVD